MKKALFYFIALLAVAMGALIIVNTSKLDLRVSVNQACLIGIFLICFVLVLFIIVSALKSEKNYKEALNFPDGTIRAIIALLSLVFFVLLAVVFYFASPPNKSNSTELQRQILTILGTLVTAVCSFYFGSKATEQGNKIAQAAFEKIQSASQQDTPADVPDSIIQQAIAVNKSKWMSLYGCLNIVVGKKQTSNTIQGTSCIVFIVPAKTDESGAEPIPPTINFTANGSSFIIPTDVQTQGASMDTLSESAQYDLLQNYIIESGADLRNKYPNITGLAAGKLQNLSNVPVQIGLIIQIDDTVDSAEIPKALLIKTYNVLTKVESTGQTTPHVGITLDSGISRTNDDDFGTTGVLVSYEGAEHILSCYHVYFNEELKHGIRSIKIGDPIANDSLVSPCYHDDNSNSNPVGKIIEGQITDFVDVAIMKPSVTVSKFSENAGPNFPYRTLIRVHENKINLVFWGNGSKTTKAGVVRNISFTQWIDYEGIGKTQINNLIQMDRCATGGDSGAAVCDGLGNFVGIILASDDNYTYVLSAFTIENKTSYTFPKS